MFKSSQRKKPIAKNPRLNRLKGLMTEYNITVARLAKYIGRCPSTVSKSNNGHNLYDSRDMQNIQKLINEKSKLKSGKYYSLDEIFTTE
ncbi:MAG: hypothetical protein PHQ35_09680 [Phycisphaerae bacterium]|nr:hypothetical protein [Phycisphaerae bacterium]